MVTKWWKEVRKEHNMAAVLTTINDHLKSYSHKNDVYTYSFNHEEVEHINRALQRYDLVKEIKELIKESK